MLKTDEIEANGNGKNNKWPEMEVCSATLCSGNMNQVISFCFLL